MAVNSISTLQAPSTAHAYPEPCVFSMVLVAYLHVHSTSITITITTTTASFWTIAGIVVYLEDNYASSFQLLVVKIVEDTFFSLS